MNTKEIDNKLKKLLSNELLLSKNNDIKVVLVKQPSYYDPPLQIKIQRGYRINFSLQSSTYETVTK